MRRHAWDYPGGAVRNLKLKAKNSTLFEVKPFYLIPIPDI